MLLELYTQIQQMLAKLLIHTVDLSTKDFCDKVEIAQEDVHHKALKVSLIHSLVEKVPNQANSADQLFSSFSKRSVIAKLKCASLSQPWMEEFIYSLLLTPRQLPNGTVSHRTHSRNPSELTDSSTTDRAIMIRPSKVKFSFTVSGAAQTPTPLFTIYRPPVFWGSLFSYPHYDVGAVLRHLTPEMLSTVVCASLTGKNILLIAKDIKLLHPAVEFFTDLLSPL